MAHSAISQLSLAVPLTDSSFQRSVFKTQSISFHDKPWKSFLPMDLKTKNSLSGEQSIICKAVLQARTSKVTVSPLALEEAEEPPLNLHKPREPYTATIVSVERLVGPKAPGETFHIVIDHGGNVPYWEGQSYGVIPPGENPKKPGTPQNVRLYSIASSRYGDFFDWKTASLCVRRCMQQFPVQLKTWRQG